MATIPKPLILVFEKDQGANFKEVRHYNLIEGKHILSNKLNIGINRGFSKAKYTYSLKIRQKNKWSKQLTGLFPTHNIYWFYGNLNNKSSLLLGKFSSNGEKLTIYLFNSFYPFHLKHFIQTFINSIKNKREGA